MKADADVAVLFLGDEERQDYEFELGTVCVRSLKSPEKETENEDAAVVVSLGRSELVLAVADGVGGNPAGREAAQMTVGTVKDMLTERQLDPERLRTAILDSVEQANQSVMGLGRGAATTIVVAEIVGRQLRGYHVGDSELLAVGQRGRIKLRVIPHSPTGFAVEAGLLDEDEAVEHDQRHVLFNVVGSAEMRVDVGGVLDLADRDTVLLATDGLLDNLFIDEIVDAMRMGPLPAAADRLVERARSRMSGEQPSGPSKPDDLTIILYRPNPAKR